MLFGHNTDIKVGDAIYHVQTEDRGESHPLIDTTVYCRGRVLHRRTNNYQDLLPLDQAHEEILRKRIDDQHRAVTEEIRSGALKMVTSPAPAKEDGASAPKPVTATAKHTTSGSAAHAGEQAPDQGKSAPASALASSILALELLNPKTWLAEKHARLQIAVRDKQTGIAIAGAKVVAHVEGADFEAKFAANSGLDGVAKLEFEMPHFGPAEVALIIEATHASAKGHLKFHLRTKARVPTA